MKAASGKYAIFTQINWTTYINFIAQISKIKFYFHNVLIKFYIVILVNVFHDFIQPRDIFKIFSSLNPIVFLICLA